jgi:hypothetical protein
VKYLGVIASLAHGAACHGPGDASGVVGKRSFALNLSSNEFPSVAAGVLSRTTGLEPATLTPWQRVPEPPISAPV